MECKSGVRLNKNECRKHYQLNRSGASISQSFRNCLFQKLLCVAVIIATDLIPFCSFRVCPHTALTFVSQGHFNPKIGSHRLCQTFNYFRQLSGFFVGNFGSVRQHFEATISGWVRDERYVRYSKQEPYFIYEDFCRSYRHQPFTAMQLRYS